MNEPVIINHFVPLKVGHRFHALLKVFSDRDDTVPFKVSVQMHIVKARLQFLQFPKSSWILS